MSQSVHPSELTETWHWTEKSVYDYVQLANSAAAVASIVQNGTLRLIYGPTVANRRILNTTPEDLMITTQPRRVIRPQCEVVAYW